MSSNTENDRNQQLYSGIEAGIAKIMEASSVSTLSENTFISDIHNYVLPTNPANSPRSRDFDDESISARSKELYGLISSVLGSHLFALSEESMKCIDEAALLYFYTHEWERYFAAAKCVNKVGRYLNRQNVRKDEDRPKGVMDAYEIYGLCLVRWRDDFLEHVQQDLINGVMKLIETHRNGTVGDSEADTKTIKAVINSLTVINVDETPLSPPILDVFQLYFVEPFLVSTATHYRMASRRFLQDFSVMEYIEQASTWIREEELRVGTYLHEDIRELLREVCRQVLILDQSELLPGLLERDYRGDLQKVNRFLRSVDGGENGVDGV